MGSLTTLLGVITAIAKAVSGLFAWLSERAETAKLDKAAHDAVAVERGQVAAEELAVKQAMNEVQHAPHDAQDIDKRLGNHTF